MLVVHTDLAGNLDAIFNGNDSIFESWTREKRSTIALFFALAVASCLGESLCALRLEMLSRND